MSAAWCDVHSATQTVSHSEWLIPTEARVGSSYKCWDTDGPDTNILNPNIQVTYTEQEHNLVKQ